MNNDVSSKRLSGLSIEHAYDPASKKLTIRGAREFPPEVFRHAQDIEILDMSGGQLHSLPFELERLGMLRIAFFSDNPLGEVPPALAGCERLEMVGLKSCGIARFDEDVLPPGLRGLILTDNNLTTLPKSIGNLASLQKLMIAGNSLRSLPQEMAHCHNLEILRMSVNEFTSVPEWLWSLPRLAWYSDAGNPLAYEPAVAADLPMIHWTGLEVQEELGRSAKNIVYKAIDKVTGKGVAVKLFGQVVSTDGLAKDELRANLASGNHPGLIPLLGTVAGAPGNQDGLVMELMPPEYTALGQPPDFKTLTRDVFTPEQMFTARNVIAMVSDLANTLQYLQDRGIMHGDIYAHNILTAPSLRPMLSDFGCASLYDRRIDKGRRESIDVRGFGYLLDDLLRHVKSADVDADRALKGLMALRDDCLNLIPAERPNFAAIARALSS
jgi:hypothetical protein